MENDDLNFGEGEDHAERLIELDGAQSITVFAAYDSEGRCAETCELDLHGTPDDVLASMREVALFLKKHKKDHSFTATGES